MVDGPVLPIETDADILARQRRERLLSGTQHSMEYSAGGQPVQRVMNASGQLDAFGRLRISEPLTLFDSTHRYNDNNKWNDVITNTSGNVLTEHRTNVSSIGMQVGSSSGDEIIRETNKVFHYQPGKGLLNLNTFLMAPAEANLRQRIGHFGAENGIYFEQDGLNVNWVLRSFSSGSIVESKAEKDNANAQLAWNIDNFDGNGPSGITLDLTKTQITWSDFEWLGAGTVRCGFIVNGKYFTAHKFHNANESTDVYMTTGTLPLRYEITNTGVRGGGNVSLQQTCSTVISEGGIIDNNLPLTVRMTAPKTGIGTAFEPLFSLRIASDSLDAIVIPQEWAALPTGTGDVEIAIIVNGELSNASWDTTTYAHADVDYAANAIANGTIVTSSYTSADNKAGQPLSNSVFDPSNQLGRTQAGVSDVYTLCARAISGTIDIIASGSFQDLTN